MPQKVKSSMEPNIAPRVNPAMTGIASSISQKKNCPGSSTCFGTLGHSIQNLLSIANTFLNFKPLPYGRG